MRLDQSLVRKTNVMDYSPLYLFFAIIQLPLLKIMDYPDHYESFSRRIFGHLMGLDHLLVRETNFDGLQSFISLLCYYPASFVKIMDYYHCYGQKIQLALPIGIHSFLRWKVNQIITFFISRSNSTAIKDRFVLHLTHNMD